MPEQEKHDPDIPISTPRIVCTEATPGDLSVTFGCQHPTCSSIAASCVLHYRLEEVWDEAGLDYWHGTCPYGHGKFIDH